MTPRAQVKDALLEILAMRRLNLLGPRRRLRRLYFQLRADGMGGRAARALVKRARKALPGLRDEPKGMGVALDLILG